MIEETRNATEFLNWVPDDTTLCNSARIALYMSENSCWSQAQMKEEGIKGKILLKWTGQTTKKNENHRKKKKENEKKKKKNGILR